MQKGKEIPLLVYVYMFTASSTKSVVSTDLMELTAMENELMPYISSPCNSKAKE